MKDFIKKSVQLLNNFPLRKKKADLKIGVIAGGISSEREVSLSTGTGIYEALKNLNYRASFIDFNGDISPLLKGIDVAFIALHGKFGEDGTIQGLLELLKVPYTGSGVLGSAAAMDKIFSKKIFRFEKIPTPDFFVPDFSCRQDSDFIEKIDGQIRKDPGYPVIIKPNKGGSSIGVTILEDKKMLEKALKDAIEHDDRVIVERFLDGRLLTVSVIGNIPVALPVIEIKPKSGFYDYKAKYTPGFTEYIVPAPLDRKTSGKISELAIRCHKMLDCSAVSRVDMILAGGKINVLEVNTIPGMTPTSLVPKAAAAAGISFELLVEIILNSASLKL